MNWASAPGRLIVCATDPARSHHRKVQLIATRVNEEKGQAVIRDPGGILNGQPIAA